jgi:hypothetical protein
MRAGPHTRSAGEGDLMQRIEVDKLLDMTDKFAREFWCLHLESELAGLDRPAVQQRVDSLVRSLKKMESLNAYLAGVDREAVEQRITDLREIIDAMTEAMDRVCGSK